MNGAFGFSLRGRDPNSAARLGEVRTAHATFPTPVFMPVATHGFMRALRIEEVAACGARIILANAYHLLVRPGAERLAALGGLRRFMGWDGAILTDSGGFQITSLPGLRKVTEDGIHFRSHVDGRELYLDPESVMDWQARLGVNIAMVLDECTPHPYTPEQLEAGVARTLRWAARAVEHGVGEGRALFAITQGGADLELRARCTRELAAMPFDGYAIGGLGVGEGRETMWQVVAAHAPALPADKPRYLMGVGPPLDIVEAVAAGVDMFDCVIPTRNARNGGVFTSDGPLTIRNAVHATDPAPLDPRCACPVCAKFSRGYLHHVFRSKDYLGGSLLSLHNMHYFQRLMEEIRESIAAGTFEALRRRIHAAYPRTEPGPRPRPRK